MIAIEYIINNDESLLTIIFDKKVLKSINVKCYENINFYQSKYDKNIFTLFKANTGYKITRYSKIKNMYQIVVKQKFLELNEFELKQCDYFINNKGIVRLKIKDNKW